MPSFEVTQRKESDSSVMRVRMLASTSEGVLRSELSQRDKGWVTTMVRRLESPATAAHGRKPRILTGRPLIRLCRAMGSMLNARIHIEDALRFYAEGLEDKHQAEAIREIRQKIATGQQPSAAFAASGMFDDVFVGLVRAGSDSGSLGNAFRAIAERTETQSRFRHRLVRATAVPLAVILFLVSVFIASQCLLVPQVEKTIREVGQQPDAFSALVFKISTVIRASWPLLAGCMALATAAIAASRTLRLRLLEFAMSRWKLLRNMVMGLRQLLFLGSLHMLTSNGISVQDALHTTQRILAGTALADELKEVIVRYRSGIPLGQSIERFTSCDHAVAHMIGMGELSGTLDEQLALLAKLYEEQTSDAMDAFIELSNLLTLAVGLGLVLFVFVGAYLPMILMGPRLMESAM